VRVIVQEPGTAIKNCSKLRMRFSEGAGALVSIWHAQSQFPAGGNRRP